MEETPFKGIDELGRGNHGREMREQVDMVAFAFELDQFHLEVGAHIPEDFL